jgi:hypothetical protein
MPRIEVVGWIGTGVALALCAVAGRMWHLALQDMRFTRERIRTGAMGPRDTPRVVARWNFTTASVHLFFAIVLVWVLLPAIPPTPRDNATVMAIGVPLTWLAGISCLLLTDLKFRRELRASVRQSPAGNVVPLRSRRSRARLTQSNG